jgi:acyl-CoA synthetase (AMP-forming)/AMP-acid ligase II
VLLERRTFSFPSRVLENLEKERATGLPITPTIASILLQMKDLSRFKLESLRYITNAAAALPVPHLRRLMTIFPHVSFFSMYGLTECTRVCYMPPAELARRPDSVGIAMPNCEAYVVDEGGNEVAAGKVGELVVRGGNVNQGYWGAPEETAERFRPGRYRGDVRLHTGDLFRRDEEGYLYFVARKDDLIKTKGERVSPREVENVLCQMEGVAEAAVVGIPDELLGQAIKAFVVWSGWGEQAASAAAVLRHCKRHLEPFMIPRKVEFRDLLPRTSSGKIDKKMLKKMREAGGGKREARS